jgi:hypothetical protein
MSLRNLFGGLHGLFRPSDQETFAKLVQNRLRSRGWSYPIVFDRERFALRLGPDNVLWLHSLFQDYIKCRPDERMDVIESIVRAMYSARPEGDYAAVRSVLLPRVCRRQELEGFKLAPAVEVKNRRGAWVGAFEPLCDVLAVHAVIDQPDKMTFVENEILKEFGAPLSTVLGQAIVNLRVRSPASFVKQEAGFFISQYQDNYDSARLLIPEIFESLPLGGAPVAIAVDRDLLVVAGAQDDRSLLAMAAFVEAELQQAVRPISYLPLLLRNGKWEVFKPGKPGLEPLVDLSVKQTLWDYRDQKLRLDKYFVEIGRDVFVATLNATAGLRGTHTLWQDQLPTLLPAADAVTFWRDNEPPFSRQWEHVIAVCSSAMKCEEFYPPRYFVASWPDTEQMAVLKARFERPDWLL